MTFPQKRAANAPTHHASTDKVSVYLLICQVSQSTYALAPANDLDYTRRASRCRLQTCVSAAAIGIYAPLRAEAMACRQPSSLELPSSLACWRSALPVAPPSASPTPRAPPPSSS